MVIMGGDEFQKSDQNPFFTLRDNFVAHHNEAREDLFQHLVAQFNKANLLYRFREIKHECKFFDGSTLSQVDAEITVDRFITQLNDAGFYVNFYYTRKEDIDGQISGFRNSSNQQNNKETVEYSFLIYWNFNSSIQSILKDNQFLKKNPSYVLNSTESQANIFIENRNKFVHEQVNLRINFEQSLTDELLNSISQSGKQKTGNVFFVSKLFSPILYFRRGYHVGAKFLQHNAELSGIPLISNSLKSANSSNPFVGFSSDGFSICGNRVPFIVEENGQKQVKSYGTFAVSGMKALYLNTIDNTGFVVDLTPRVKELNKENPDISEIYKSINPTVVQISGLTNLLNNPRVKFAAQENGQSFIISLYSPSNKKGYELFYSDISSEPLDLKEINLVDDWPFCEYENLFHPSKKQFLSTSHKYDIRRNSRTPVIGGTRLLKFNKNKVNLVSEIFTDNPSMNPKFSNDGNIILSMSHHGTLYRHLNGEQSPTAGAYGDAKQISISSDKKYCFLVSRQRNTTSRTWLLNDSGDLIKSLYNAQFYDMQFCSGEPEIEEAIQRVMTMVEEAGISIRMEGNESFRMTWDWEV